MTIAARIAALSLAAAALLVPASASAYDAPSCFWGRPTDPDVINVFYPDEGATYWAARPVAVPPGGELIVRGTYPHARYMSFNVYDEQIAPVDALADIEIAPDAGSSNPFHEGADRTAASRAYTIRVSPGPVPASREPNTIYLSLAGAGAHAGSWMLYRVYVPDAGTDLTGDGGLPSVEMRSGDGTIVDMTARCDAAAANRPLGSEFGGVPVQQQVTDGSAPGAAAAYPSSDPIHWEKFFNLPHAQTAYATHGTPGNDTADAAFGREQGGYLSNAHNAYVFATANRALGDVLVLRGRAPAVPRTREGATVMDGGDMRYWSLCTNERHSTRWIDCAVDEEVTPAIDGTYTIVVSSPQDRPSNATAACGITWLAWGTSPETFLILRHMLPDAGFEHAIQRVARPGDVESVVGDYLPAGHHTTRDAFEALGCG